MNKLLLGLFGLFSFGLPNHLIAGQVWAWGSPPYHSAQVPANLTNVVSISSGQGFDLALSSDGSITGWGWNGEGECNVPVGSKDTVAISAGYPQSMALHANGTVTAWGGNNISGELTVPLGLSQVVAVSAGMGYNLALRADGTVVAWGFNDSGQCTVPAELTNAIAVSAGGAHNLALKADGTVVGWGNNSAGECNVPADLTNAIAVSAGGEHSLAVRADGTVAAWGSNFYGERDVPAGLTNAIAVVASRYCSLALKADGTVVNWGMWTNISSGLSNVTAISGRWSMMDAYPTFLAIVGVQPKVTISFIGPTNQTIGVGSQALFFVSAIGSLPMNYQWYFGANAIAGATNRWLALNNVQPSQIGIYTVVVSNSQGSATSQPLTLSVLPALDLNMVPAITLKGAAGSTYRIDYINAIGSTNVWNTLATVTLTNSPQFYADFSAIGQPARYYRLVQVP